MALTRLRGQRRQHQSSPCDRGILGRVSRALPGAGGKPLGAEGSQFPFPVQSPSAIGGERVRQQGLHIGWESFRPRVGGALGGEGCVRPVVGDVL